MLHNISSPTWFLWKHFLYIIFIFLAVLWQSPWKRIKWKPCCVLISSELESLVGPRGGSGFTSETRPSCKKHQPNPLCQQLSTGFCQKLHQWALNGSRLKSKNTSSRSERGSNSNAHLSKVVGFVNYWENCLVCVIDWPLRTDCQTILVRPLFALLRRQARYLSTSLCKSDIQWFRSSAKYSH